MTGRVVSIASSTTAPPTVAGMGRVYAALDADLDDLASTTSAPATMRVSAASSPPPSTPCPRESSRVHSGRDEPGAMPPSPNVVRKPASQTMNSATPAREPDRDPLVERVVRVRRPPSSARPRRRRRRAAGRSASSRRPSSATAARRSGGASVERVLDRVLVAEVDPPERRAQRECEQGDEDEPARRARGPPRRRRSRRSTRRGAMITTSPWRSTKCATPIDEALDAREPRREPQQDRGERPEDALRVAAERAADQRPAPRRAG